MADFWSRFLVAPGLWLLLLFAFPIFLVLGLSFGYVDDLGRAVYSSELDNYKDAFDPTYLPVLLRSVLYAVATAALCLAIGYPIAYYIARFGGKYKYVLIAALVLPFFVNYLVRTYAWVALLSDEGLVNNFLIDLGVTQTGIQMINTPWAVIGGLTYGYLVFMILPIYASLDRMDPSVIEAGKDLYGSKLQTFLHVTLPQTKQGILAGLGAGLPAGGRRLRRGAAARRARHLHGRQPDPGPVLRRQQLAVRLGADRGDDDLPLDLHDRLPALGGA